jgi:NAD(P)-dependent dehydrogenase (short-subunit alcohol dehydrogenase family)
MKRVLIFGSNSTLAKKIQSLIKSKKFLIAEYPKEKLNFLKKNCSSKIKKILLKENPDIILNFAGILGSNNKDYRDIYDVNFLPNWEIIRFFLKNSVQKKIKIIFIGSTSYKKGKANYMLYSSSKAALNNLYQAAKEKFKNSNIKFLIFHPPRFKSKLIKNLKSKGQFENINIVANNLLKKIK